MTIRVKFHIEVVYVFQFVWVFLAVPLIDPTEILQ